MGADKNGNLRAYSGVAKVERPLRFLAKKNSYWYVEAFNAHKRGDHIQVQRIACAVANGVRS